MVSSLSSLANAPCCHNIGAFLAFTWLNLSCLNCNALWHNSNLSSNIFQNVSKSLLLDKATSGSEIVTTP